MITKRLSVMLVATATVGVALLGLGLYGSRRWWRRQQQQQYAWFVPHGTESEPERKQFVFRVER
jgi:hypothetical protein